MVMLQVNDLPSARERARAAGVREVFEVERGDISEVHLHPRHARRDRLPERSTAGWVVALGWAGWTERAVPGRVAGATIAVADPDTVAGRWATIAGGPPNGCTFVPDERSKGLIEIEPELGGIVRTLRIAS